MGFLQLSYSLGNLFIAKMSAATAAVILVLLAGWVAQRQLVTGLTMRAIK